MKPFKAYLSYHHHDDGHACFLSLNKYSISGGWQEDFSYVNLNAFQCLRILKDQILAIYYTSVGHFRYIIVKKEDPELYEQVREIIEGPCFVQN